MPEILKQYREALDESYSPALIDYLATLAAQSLKSIEVLNSFTDVHFRVEIEK